MEFLEILRQRYSCKHFDGRAVEPQQLQTVLEAGRLAPTAKNLQGQRIYVAQSPESLEKIDKITPCRYHAKTVLIVAYRKDQVYIYPGGQRDSGVEDSSIVATHMMLAAAAMGVDSCWVNFFDPQKAAEELGLPENEEVVMFLDLGYRAQEGTPLPNHFKRKDLSETVSYI